MTSDRVHIQITLSDGTEIDLKDSGARELRQILNDIYGDPGILEYRRPLPPTVPPYQELPLNPPPFKVWTDDHADTPWPPPPLYIHVEPIPATPGQDPSKYRGFQTVINHNPN